MKQKLITAFAFVVLIAGAVNAQKSTKKLAAEMVDKLGTEVTLSKEQKAALQKKTEDYVLKMQEANTLSDKKQLFEMHKKAFEAYNATLDSTLTKGQKTQRENKIKERETKENTNK